jgi:hypothetical protein
LVVLAVVLAASGLLVQRLWATRLGADWSLGGGRLIEPRLSDPRADHHRPFRASRGPSDLPARDYRLLARLQRSGDLRGLVSRLLMSGDGDEARLMLTSDPALDNERAVLALLDGKPRAALPPLARLLARAPTSSQARWNRALALRDLGLPVAAADLFASVSALGESGWSEEARRTGDQLRAAARDRKRRYQAVRADLDRMITEGAPASEATLALWPEPSRDAIYEAMRRAPNAQAIVRLEPVARALAGSAERALPDYLSRLARRDFARRAPLAQRYAALVTRQWKESAPDELAALARDLRAAGPDGDDLLLGVLLAQPRVAIDLAEPDRLAAASGDAWLRLAAEESTARLEADSSAAGKRERRLRGAIERARAGGRPWLRLVLEQRLVPLLLRQQRSIDAAPAAREALALARQLGDWGRELQALSQMLDVAAYQQDILSAQAYGREIELLDEPCGRWRVAALERLAEQLVYERDYDQSRQAIRARLACPVSAFLEIPALTALSELARLDATGPEALAFQRELERFRVWLKARGLTGSPLDGLYVTVLEGRSVIDADRARGRQILEGALAEIESRPGGGRELATPRLQAYRRLTSDAMKAGDAARALSFMVRESGLPLPSGCILAVSQDTRRGTVVARVDDRVIGHWGDPVQASAPEKVLPPQIRSALAGCPEVGVLALSPFRGRAGLLPPQLAWRHLTGAERSTGRPWVPARHVVVSDIVAAPELRLPALEPWVAPPGARIDRHLRGADATPAAVLAELQSADLIELHVHGVADFDASDAPYLVLSPGPDGNSRLSAEDVRAVTLGTRPLVVLAACDTSRNSPYHPSYSGNLGLPAALLERGARAVLAADRPLPDHEASLFVAEVLDRIQKGASGAVALRDTRMAWLKTGQADWADQIVVFE